MVLCLSLVEAGSPKVRLAAAEWYQVAKLSLVFCFCAVVLEGSEGVVLAKPFTVEDGEQL